MENKMAAKSEIVRLIAWLQEHGNSSDEIVECLNFVYSTQVFTTKEKD